MAKAQPPPQLPPSPKADDFYEMVDHLNKINREPIASVLIWHVHLEYLLDWIIRKRIKKPEELLTRLNFNRKIFLVDGFGVLSEKTIAHLFVVNTIRNYYAHRKDWNTPYFNRLCRIELKKLDWFSSSKMQQKKKTINLYSELANETYHELHKLYFRL